MMNWSGGIKYGGQGPESAWQRLQSGQLDCFAKMEVGHKKVHPHVYHPSPMQLYNGFKKTR